MSAATSSKVRTDLALALFANSFEKFIGFLIILVIARQLSKEAVGELFYVTALIAIAVLLSNLGMGGYLTRTIAQEPEHALRHLSTILSLRLVLLIVVLSALNLVMFALRPELATAMLLGSIYLGFEELYFTFSTLFLGLRIIAYRIVISVVGKIVLLLLVLGALAVQPTLTNVLWSYVAAYSLQLILIYLAARYLVGAVYWRWDWSGTVDIVRRTWPLWAILVLSILHSKLDTIMLGAMSTLAIVAIYEAAYKFLEVSRFVLRPVRQIYFPIYSEMSAKRQWQALRHSAGLAIGLATLAGLAAIIFVMLFGQWVITVLFGDKYLDAVPVIKLLFWSAPAVFIGFVCLFLAIALHLERQMLPILGLAIIFNAALNAFMIPRFGALGAAGSTVLSESLMAMLLLWLCWSHLRRWVTGGKSGIAPIQQTSMID